MPLADLNLVYDAHRGDKSRWVYRMMNGRVFFSRRPNPKKQTPAQRATRENFCRASALAKGILADPLRRAPYEARARSEGRPLRQLIIADLLAGKSESGPSLNPQPAKTAVSKGS